MFKKVVFCKASTQQTNEFGKFFQEVFPEVHKELINLKSGNDEDSYKEVAYMLQRKERLLDC
jgi:hypothetical protein